VSLKESTAVIETVQQLPPGADHGLATPAPIPEYLQQTYWWAYLHPMGVHLFERQWLVNLILWGNFTRLRDEALQEMGPVIDGSVLQVACVYGDFTEHLVQRLGPNGSLDVVDVAPIQLSNLEAKLKDKRGAVMHHQDSSHMHFEDASRDYVVVFFLLHEQPESVRRKTIAEALRIAKPGGKVIFVDYHRPVLINPFRYVMVPILTLLEPFAMDLWRQDITEWLPSGLRPEQVEKETFFGGLYQKVVVTL
jgi:ubiquinone/menaquinone biosynthesis C-methylase UbiE